MCEEGKKRMFFLLPKAVRLTLSKGNTASVYFGFPLRKWLMWEVNAGNTSGRKYKRTGHRERDNLQKESSPASYYCGESEFNHAGTGSQALGDEAVGSSSTSLSLVVVWGLFRQARREIPSISGLLTALMQSRLSQPKNSSRQRIQGTGCWKSSGACENGVMDKTSFSHTHLPNSIIRVNLGYLTSC